MFTTSFSLATRATALALGTAAALFTASAASADTAPKPDVAIASIAPKVPRYCFRTETTGSRILGTMCKTHAEWLEEGIEPNAFRQRLPKAVNTSGSTPSTMAR